MKLTLITFKSGSKEVSIVTLPKAEKAAISAVRQTMPDARVVSRIPCVVRDVQKGSEVYKSMNSKQFKLHGFNRIQTVSARESRCS